MHALPSTPLSYVQTVITHYQPKLSEGTVNSLKDFLHIHQSSLVVLLLPQHHPPSPPSFQIHFLINGPHNTAFASWALTKVGRPSVETVLKEINPRCSISFHFLDLKPAWPVQKRHSSAVVLTQWPHWVCSTTTYHRNVTILACKMVPGTVLVLRSCKVFIQSSAAGCSVTITFKSP